jgi:hypothetical protein
MNDSGADFRALGQAVASDAIWLITQIDAAVEETAQG